MTQMTMVRPTAVPPPCGAERRELRVLLARAVDAWREGCAAPVPPSAHNKSDQQLNEELADYVSERLSRTDTTGLGRIGELRERALALARAGQTDEAEANMKAARFLLSVSNLSLLGRTAAETLQQAAEAFLAYRKGDFADAGARMEASLAATDLLADAWGESLFTTGRRIHLLHNRMKVEARRGAAREAMVLGGGILAHLTGSAAGLRLAALGRPAPLLEPAFADSFADLVAGTAAEVLAEAPESEARSLARFVAGIAPGERESAARAWAWLPLKRAALAGDPHGFLGGAAPFLRVGRGRAAALWYAVALDVVRAAQVPGLGATPDGLVEIAAELVGDPRVPKAIQAAARYALA